MNNELIEQIKTNVPLVYEAGKNKGIKEMEPQLEEKYEEGRQEGFTTGKDVGIKEGKKAEYDAFWDAYQIEGTRSNYDYAFYRSGWRDENFCPKYNMSPTTASSMFRYSACTKVWDIIEEQGITIDFSNCTEFNYTFANFYSPRIGVVDMRNATAMSYAFGYNYARVTTIEKIISGENTPFSNSVFNTATGLETLIIEGTIGKNGFNVQWSTLLNKASIESIINALSTTTSGLTVTLSKTAVNNAFGINVDDASTYPEGSEYYELRQSKSNWTINYV